MVATAVTAAGARGVTRLEPLVSFYFFITLMFIDLFLQYWVILCY